MLYRDSNGKLIQINRFYYDTDKEYYISIMNFKNNTKKVILNEYPLVNILYNMI